jgi:hypothetical protein
VRHSRYNCASKRPWKGVPGEIKNGCLVRHAKILNEDGLVAEIQIPKGSRVEINDTMGLIVQAVNNHEDLISVLKSTLRWCRENNVVIKGRGHMVLMEKTFADANGYPFDWQPLPEFGCFVQIHDGSLLAASMMNDGSIEMDRGEVNACDVCAPESQEFLDAVNAVFGTSYRMDQFSGR